MDQLLNLMTANFAATRAVQAAPQLPESRVSSSGMDSQPASEPTLPAPVNAVDSPPPPSTAAAVADGAASLLSMATASSDEGADPSTIINLKNMNGGDDSRTVVNQSQASLPDTLPPFGNGGGKVAVAQHSADPDVHLAKAPRDLLDTRAATGASALQPSAGMPSK